MGIPSYFSYIIKNYSNIIRNLQFFTGETTIHHLYMDCNSIIYDAVRSVDVSAESDNIEDAILSDVISKIEDYVRMIKPTKSVFIAFDGVAPLAKMEQQRTRRYKTYYMSTLNYGKPATKAQPTKWNTAAITPGTAFMNKLSTRITRHFENLASAFGVNCIHISCSDQHGEGEHKLFELCRTDCSTSDNVAVYGLDADLIMLSIFHCKYAKNIYVFREAPEFLKSSIPIQVRGGDSNAPYFLDIRELSRRILDEMDCKHNDEHRLHDYVFLCFLLGNDFLPHFPAMNIRTHGIQALLDLYRMYIGNAPDRFFISKQTGKIEWKVVKAFIGEIAKREHEFLLNEYGVRAKWDRRTFPETTEKEKEDLLTNVPMLFRQEEKYICPEEGGWESRYYKCLFRMGKDTTKEDIREVCVNYLEGLEWVYSYYTTGCLDWTWKYHYAYPPLFADLFKHVPDSDVSLFPKDISGQRPLSPYAQLAYVLPRGYLSLLPENMSTYLEDAHSELYLDVYKFQWAFCRYFWESHPLLPEVSFDRLSEIDTALVSMA